ncbi:hypothetical protein GCM10007092_18430 [Thermus composti]|nr:hypothetical protein GCM10007092_18430 [Thermus composti]
MNLLEAPYPVFRLGQEGVERNALAQDLPLPQGEVLWWRGKGYRAVRLPAPEGTYLLLLEDTARLAQARAYQGLLRLLEKLLRGEPPEALLQSLLEEAVALVPGAEAGSVLLREGPFFYLVAQVGFSEKLLGARTTVEEEMAWYGLGVNNWLLGRPRVLKGAEIRQLSHLSTLEARPLFFTHGRLGEIQATLEVPIALQGEVLAVMNLDNFQDPEAFSPLSLELAQGLALEAALLLKTLEERKALEAQARTDPLTGLGNRRALEEAFPNLLREAQSRGEPLTLVYWDLNGLKRLNDRLGHAAGDQAIKAVAQALREAARRQDLVFRVGGDEFVSLHPGLPFPDAQALIARVKARLPHKVAAGAVEAQGEDLAHLLQEADQRMYLDKAKEGP